MKVLAGDIGGTNARLALCEASVTGLELGATRVYRSRDSPSLAEIVQAFVDEHDARVDHLCVGVPGPVRDGHCRTTNLPWIVDAAELAKRTSITTVSLINDLEANAYGLAWVDDDDFTVLHPGASDGSGNAALISAGTGLGEAGLFWDGREHRPFACEGGHADFAPADALEVELWGYLSERFGDHVSWERVVSGPGLHLLYQFLRDRGADEPGWLADALAANDPEPPVVIANMALARKSALCERALALFMKLYGSEAGNLALKVMATGGVYLGGGIAPHIVDALQTSGFVAAFVAKGRMRPLLERMSIRVVLDDRAALYGAARFAALHANLPQAAVKDA